MLLKINFVNKKNFGTFKIIRSGEKPFLNRKNLILIAIIKNLIFSLERHCPIKCVS